MANRYAIANGNFSDTSTWSTTYNGAGGASVPVAGDNAYSNNHAVAVTANATCDQVSNNNNNSAVAGGNFTLSNGVVLTANVLAGTTVDCVTYAGTSGNNAYIVASTCKGISVGAAFSNTSTGTLNVTCPAITAQTGGNRGYGGYNSSTGTINIIGNVTGGTGGTNGWGIYNNGGGTIIVNGTVTAGTESDGNGQGINSTGGTLDVTGDVYATSSNNGIVAVGTVKISGSTYDAANGMVAIYAQKYYLNTSPGRAVRQVALDGSSIFVTFYTANHPSSQSGQASVSDVRKNTVYGPTNNLTGTAYIPAASSVAAGVNVDNAVGTAVITASGLLTALGMASGNMDTRLNGIISATNAAIATLP